MTPLRLIFLSATLALTAACATPGPAIGELTGLDQFKTICPDEPPVLTDEQAQALAETMPTAEQRERSFWAPQALALRKCLLHERARADGAVAAGEAYNQAVRDSD